MASNELSSILLVDDTICKLCNEIYDYKDGPLVLPCLHSFCRKCLNNHIASANVVQSTSRHRQTFLNVSASKRLPSCPCCKLPFSQGIDKLKVNLRLSRLAERKAFENKITEGSLVCQMCSRNPPRVAQTFLHCTSKFLCICCKDMLLRMFDRDQFIDFKKESKELPEVSSHESLKCPNHPKYELELFCKDCDTMICCMCAQLVHLNHERLSIQDGAKQYRRELVRLEKALQVALDRTMGKLSQAPDHEKLIVRSERIAMAKIDRACNILVETVEKQRKNLKQQCLSVRKSKSTLLSSQVEDLKCLKEKLSFTHSQANDFIENASPDELLSINSELKSSLEYGIKVYARQPIKLLDDYSFRVTGIDNEPTALTQKINELGSMEAIPCLSMCFVELADSTVGQRPRRQRRDQSQANTTFTIAVGTTFLLYAHVRNAQNKPVLGLNCLLEYKVEQLEDDLHDIRNNFVPLKNPATEFSRGRGKIEFTPDQQGRYKLTVLIQSEPIDTPYTIIAKCPQPEFHNMSKWVTHPFGPCYGVAVSDNGTVYATNQDVDLIKVGLSGGESLSNIFGNQLCKPWGIAIGSEDRLYVSSSGNHMIRVFSSTGKPFGGFGAKGTCNGQFLTPLGICVSPKEQLVVADFNNSRIQIFDLNGMFLKVFPCSGSPYDVAVDNNGNIHVALKDKHCIAVYKDSGRLIKSYTYSSLGHLTCSNLIQSDSEFLPTSLSFNGKYMAIGTRNKKIHVADLSGGIDVPLIPSKSTTVRSCIDGLAIAKDNTVYVAERDCKVVCSYKPVMNL